MSRMKQEFMKTQEKEVKISKWEAVVDTGEHELVIGFKGDYDTFIDFIYGFGYDVLDVYEVKVGFNKKTRDYN